MKLDLDEIYEVNGFKASSKKVPSIRVSLELYPIPNRLNMYTTADGQIYKVKALNSLKHHQVLVEHPGHMRTIDKYNVSRSELYEDVANMELNDSVVDKIIGPNLQ